MANTTISQLTRSNSLNANTFNDIFLVIDLGSNTSLSLSQNTLARGLYANNTLRANANVVLTNASVLVFNDGTTMSTASVGGGGVNLDTLANTNKLTVDTTLTKFLVMNMIAGNNMLITANNLAKELGNNNTLYANGGIIISKALTGIQFFDETYQITAWTQATFDYFDGLIFGHTTRLNSHDSSLSSQASLASGNNTYLKLRADVANTNSAVIRGTDLSQNVQIAYANTTLVIFQGVNDGQNTNITVVQGTDTTQNTNITVIQNTDLSQNVQIAFANSKMIINDGINTTQNTNITVVQGTDLSQNVQITYGNTRSLIIENTDLSQNVQITFANARMTIIEGTDTSQNSRMTIIEGTDVGQNTRISLLEITNAVQNTSAIQNNNTFIFGTTTLNYKQLVATGNIAVTGNLILSNSSITSNVADIGGTVSTVTIDFNKDSIIRVNTATALTVTLANPTAGKTIQLLIVNTSGTACTITHGCTALNSSMGATTFSQAATRTSLSTYICTNANVANVFVATVFS